VTGGELVIKDTEPEDLRMIASSSAASACTTELDGAT
jgi:hypothetical protein